MDVRRSPSRPPLLLGLVGATTVAVGLCAARPWAAPQVPPPAHGLAKAPAKAPQRTTLRALALGDMGSGDGHQRALGLQMAALHRRRPVDLVVMAGDNLYPDGDLARADGAFLRPYAELLAAGVPFHAVLGNHDIRTANGNPQVAYGPFGMGGRWYTLRRGPVEFFCLDTNVNADWGRQLPWLRGALAASTAPWKVVVGHHPIYSSGLYGNDPAARERLAPLFKRYGVALYINGHDHNYERSRVIDGTTYLVVGGGGASLRPVLATAQTAKARSVFSFAELEATPQRLAVRAIDVDGQTFDEAVIASP